MATYTVQGPPHAGAQVTYQAPVSGDLAPTGAGIGLLVKNASATSMNVTLPVTPTYDGLTVTARVVAVPSSTDALIPLPDSVYGSNPTTVNYSATASVSVACIRIP